MHRILAICLTIAAVAPAAGAAPGIAAATTAQLDVPYLPQTDALCGGAAAAMVFRYWGDRHADVQQFAPLVDRQAGGIHTAALIASIRERGWAAEEVNGSLAMLQTRIESHEPVILLIDTRSSDSPSYHYVVVIAAGQDQIVFHDPAWGPSRRMTSAELMRAWQSSNYWALAVRPAANQLLAPRDDFSEQAGRWFAEKRWADAESTALKALAENPSDEYALDVLGSSRYMRNDLAGSLRAWNLIGKPRVDRVEIKGLSRTRYALAAEWLGIEPNELLTESRFRLADRRLQHLPDRTSSRIGFRPDGSGFAAVDIVAVERQRSPRGAMQWIAAGAQAIFNREIRADVPGWSGQGEVWSGSWRWWEKRPRVAFALATPRTGWMPGVLRVDTFWEAQTYGAPSVSDTFRQAQTHVGLETSNWLTGTLQYAIAGGVDSWDDRRRAVFLSGTIDRRWLGDRVSTSASVRHWLSWTGVDFTDLTLDARLHWSPEAAKEFRPAIFRNLVWLAAAGFERASDAAPLSLWPGAGEGHGRVPFVRAHKLLQGGVVMGPVFGRSLEYAGGEVQRWFDRPSMVRIGAAAFVDTAHASRRIAFTTGDRFQVDAGVGLRARVPGRNGLLRIDYARGLRDGANAVTLGWMLE